MKMSEAQMGDDREWRASDGRSEAEEAVMAALARQPASKRLSEQIARRLVDIAWSHQFQIEDRRLAREEIKKAIQPEVSRRMERAE